MHARYLSLAQLSATRGSSLIMRMPELAHASHHGLENLSVVRYDERQHIAPAKRLDIGRKQSLRGLISILMHAT